MQPSIQQITDLRANFLKKLSEEGGDSVVHSVDLERIKTSDDWVRRFLLHHDNDMNLALKMMWDTCEWRKQFGANEISESNIRVDYLIDGSLFSHSKDVDGCALLIFKCKLHVKGQRDFEELKRCLVYWFERLEREENGKPISVFFDMEGCGLSNMDMEYTKYLINILKMYYPYFLNYIIIYEMAWILNAAFKIIKSLLPEKAVAKMKFVNKSNIKDFVPLEQALSCWGGQDDYVFSFIPETRKDQITNPPVSTNNKKVHFADGSPMSENTNTFGEGEPEISPCSTKAGSNCRQLFRHHYDSSVQYSCAHGCTEHSQPCHISKMNLKSAEESPYSQSHLQLLPAFVEQDGILSVSPSSCITFVKDGTELTSTVTLLNTDDKISVSYKMKTTSPEKFRVRPSAGCLAPGVQGQVTVTLLQGFQLGGLSRDKFLVMSQPIDNPDMSPQELAEIWKNTSGKKISQHKLRCSQPQTEITKNGSAMGAISSDSESTQITKLSARITQLTECQSRLHTAVKRMQNIQYLTLLLIIFMGISVLYVLRKDIRDSFPIQDCHFKQV